MTERILVSFTADDAGLDELSWGQYSIWKSITDAGSSLPIGGTTQAPPGMTVGGAVAMLRYFMCRHQSLRTRVVTGEDGRTLQQVHTSGSVPLEVVDAGDDDVDEVAERIKDRYYDSEFDYVTEWPIRMAAVARNGTVARIVAVFCHIAVDAHGIDAMVADLASMDPATGEPTGPVTGLPPMAQVAQQRTPSARRWSDNAIRYAERLIRDVPARRYQDSDDPRDPRWRVIGYDSPASYLAALTIAERNRVHTTPVLLAAFAVAISEVTRVHPAVAQLVVHNRFRPGLALAVAPISQEVVGVIHVEDSTFDEIVTRSWQASTRAGKHAYYDPVDMADMVARVSRERGEYVDLDCYFNDRRRLHLFPPPLDHRPTPDELAAARVAGAVRWDPPMKHYDHTAFFHVNDVPGTIDYLMAADTHHLSPADMETVVCRMEDVLVGAVLDPDARIRSLSRKAASVEC